MVPFDAKQAAARGTSRNYSSRAYCPCEVRVRRRCGNEIWQNLSTKHLSTSWLADSRQQRTWLNLYLECQQLNYYTAQREFSCVCVLSVCVLSVWSCAVKCTDGWLIHQSCDSSITAVTISLPPSEFFRFSVISSPFIFILAIFLLMISIVRGCNKLPLNIFLHPSPYWCNCDILCMSRAVAKL